MMLPGIMTMVFIALYLELVYGDNNQLIAKRWLYGRCYSIRCIMAVFQNNAGGAWDNAKNL
jgi:K(+)-stimulated pyrophosphate-energized sodium pump